jgi:HAD superfamily hydrolase (TIGR01549 family)
MKRRPRPPRLRGKTLLALPAPPRRKEPAFLFDLDGTLVDSAYEHTVAWRNALRQEGHEVATWKVHRRIGMSGGLITRSILTELDGKLTPEVIDRVKKAHTREYEQLVAEVRPLPGAVDLLHHLTQLSVPWIIATSARAANARRTLAKLGFSSLDHAVTRDDVERAKPDPDLFLAAADRLGIPIARCMVVGDSVWDIVAARRAGALGVGLLTGGTSRDELERAGALRVYEDPSDLLKRLHELGARSSEFRARVDGPSSIRT